MIIEVSSILMLPGAYRRCDLNFLARHAVRLCDRCLVLTVAYYWPAQMLSPTDEADDTSSMSNYGQDVFTESTTYRLHSISRSQTWLKPVKEWKIYFGMEKYHVAVTPVF